MRITLIILAACLAVSHAAHAQKRYILIDGSSTVNPVVKVAAAEYLRQIDSGIEMEVDISGTSGGFRKFIAKEIDIAGASRPINREEIKATKDYGIRYIEVPIAYDALTIAVNPDVTWTDSIKITELKTMWERAAEGKITTWNQIRPEWPNTPLKLFGAGRDSGTFDYFQDAVTGKKAGIRSDYVSSENDDELIHGIEQTPGALGFIPYAYFFKEGKKLKALAVQCDYDAVRDAPVPGAPATLPSEEAVLSGAYTPFGRPMFLYVNAASLEAKPHLKDFLLFFLINADTFVDQVHYLSLPKISYARSIAALESKQIGTRFFGVPEIGLSVTDMIQRRPR